MPETRRQLPHEAPVGPDSGGSGSHGLAARVLGQLAALRRRLFGAVPGTELESANTLDVGTAARWDPCGSDPDASGDVQGHTPRSSSRLRTALETLWRAAVRWVRPITGRAPGRRGRGGRTASSTSPPGRTRRVPVAASTPSWPRYAVDDAPPEGFRPPRRMRSPQYGYDAKGRRYQGEILYRACRDGRREGVVAVLTPTLLARVRGTPPRGRCPGTGGSGTGGSAELRRGMLLPAGLGGDGRLPNNLVPLLRCEASRRALLDVERAVMRHVLGLRPGASEFDVRRRRETFRAADLTTVGNVVRLEVVPRYSREAAVDPQVPTHLVVTARDARTGRSVLPVGRGSSEGVLDVPNAVVTRDRVWRARAR